MVSSRSIICRMRELIPANDCVKGSQTCLNYSMLSLSLNWLTALQKFKEIVILLKSVKCSDSLLNKNLDKLLALKFSLDFFVSEFAQMTEIGAVRRVNFFLMLKLQLLVELFC